VCGLAIAPLRPLDPMAAGACVLAFVAAARARLYVGAGSAMATQLAFLPMLWLLPLGWVPLTVAAALVLSAAPDVALRRERPERLLTRVGDAGYAVGPVLVLALAGEGARDPAWSVIGLAFLAQSVLDAALSVGREWAGRGIRPAVQLDVMRTVYGVDVLLLPIGIVIAEDAAVRPLVVLVVIPLSLLLAAVAADRNRRLDDASCRLGEVERERERVNVAIDRVARSLGSGLDREAVLEIALGTAVDAVGAELGRARLAGSFHAMTFEASPGFPPAAEPEALLAAERAALAGHAAPASRYASGWAIARGLRPGGDDGGTLGAIAVCRSSRPFSRDEEELFSYLAAQAAASIETVDLHERLRGGL
jgi:hypothetical protein